MEARNLDTASKYKLSAKKPSTGKYWGYIWLEVNKWGNWGASAKVDDDFIELVKAHKGKYINFSVYEHGPNNPAPAPESVRLDDEVPF